MSLAERSWIAICTPLIYVMITFDQGTPSSFVMSCNNLRCMSFESRIEHDQLSDYEGDVFYSTKFSSLYFSLALHL
jgi:hypothetical protein